MVTKSLQKRKRWNILMFGLTAICTAFSLTVLFFILGYIATQGVSALNWDFFTELPKPVGEVGGGIAHAIVGSTKVISIASVIGIPIGVMGGVYLAEYGNNKTGFLIRYCSDVMNGIPSIVIAIFAYTLVVLPMKQFSTLAGGVALAMIMIPLILRNSEEFIRMVPHTLREAGLALGLPQWRVIMKIILPSASRGILTGAILAISRISGETAPLLFTAFGNQFWSEGVMQPTAALPLTIYAYAISPYKDWHQQAWAAALILLALVLLGNIISRYVLRPKHGTA